jgi:predicted glycosyltransferase
MSRAVKRVLMYSQDGWGLGHLRRSFNIAGELLSLNPACDILIVADSPAVSIMSTHPRIEVLKLPTVIKTGDNSWRNATLSGRPGPVLQLRAKLLLETARAFKPDVILVDHMPVGAMGELKPMLEHVAAGRRRPRLLLGLRDIIDSPQVVRRVWQQLEAYDYLPAYDGLMVYGSRAIYDAAAAYGLDRAARSISFCDYVSTRPGGAPARRTALPYVLMIGGGGNDAFPLASTFIDALKSLNGDLGLNAVMLTGPNMSAEERDALVRRLPRMLRIAPPFDDATPWIRGAAAVVTMAGYNSLCELLRWQKKALVVPRPGPSAEQRMRSDLFSQRSLIRLVAPERLSTKTLADELGTLLHDAGVPDPARIPQLDGARRSAHILLGTGENGAGNGNGFHRRASLGMAAAAALGGGAP